DVIHEMARNTAERPAERTDHASRDGGIEAEWAADGDDELAHTELGRVAELRVRQIGGIRLDHSQVAPWIGTHDPAGNFAPIVETDANAFLAVNHMVIRQQKPVRREENPGAGAGAVAVLARPAKIDDSGSQRIGDADDDAREGVESLVVAGQRIGLAR